MQTDRLTIHQTTTVTRCRPAAILNFRIPLILMADELWGSQMHHLAKFHQNQSSSFKHIAISPVFQDDGRPPSWTCFPCYWTYIWWSLLLRKIWLKSMIYFPWYERLKILCIWLENAYPHPDNNGGTKSQKFPFPFGHVEPPVINTCRDQPHSSLQATARSVHTLLHNYATKSPLVTMGRPKFTPKTAPSPSTITTPN